jgi:exopolyphosphatase/guanosine-5'-triphosphate,3'-diphosphate pyrophosphatase
MGVGRIDVFATEATRRASNGGELVSAIAAETELPVRVLTGEEEASFAGLGVISGFFRPTGIVGDMGGGSLEIIEVLDDRTGKASVSLPLGALPVETLLASHKDRAKDKVDALLELLPPSLNEPVFYAVGGSWRALAKAHMEKEAAPVCQTARKTDP